MTHPVRSLLTAAATLLALTASAAGAAVYIPTKTADTADGTCGADCSESVTDGTPLTLTTAPAAGSTFAGWSGACSGTGTCTLTVTAATTVTATFNTTLTPVTTTLTPVTLSVTKSGPGTISSAPAGIINCGATCSQSVTPGTVR